MMALMLAVGRMVMARDMRSHTRRLRRLEDVLAQENVDPLPNPGPPLAQLLLGRGLAPFCRLLVLLVHGVVALMAQLAQPVPVSGADRPEKRGLADRGERIWVGDGLLHRDETRWVQVEEDVRGCQGRGLEEEGLGCAGEGQPEEWVGLRSGSGIGKWW